MERRRNTRLAIVREVLLCCSQLGLVRCKTTDISQSGAFVKTNMVNVDQDIDVDVCFLKTSGKINSVHKVSAKVTRVVDQGLGLQFNEAIDSEWYTA